MTSESTDMLDATLEREAAAKELHGLAAGDTPERADWTIDQGWERYTPAEHAVWKTLFERQSKLLPGHACDEFVEGMVVGIEVFFARPGVGSVGFEQNAILTSSGVELLTTTPMLWW